MSLLLGLSAFGCGDDGTRGGGDTGADDANTDPSWRIVASGGLMIGEYGDNFVYDGSNVRAGDGELVIDVDPVAETGRLEGTWTGTHVAREATLHTGVIRIVIEEWVPMRAWEQGGIAVDQPLHGDTGAGPSFMPTVHAFLAGWGPAEVYVNDVLEYEIHGHFMYTDGARQPDGVIYKSDRTTPYDPETPADSWVDPDDREVHLVAHSSDPDRLNYPMHTIWFHLNFEEPVVERAPSDALR